VDDEMPRVGRVLGTEDSTPLEFWVGIEEETYLQLDDVVMVETDVPGAGPLRVSGLVDMVRTTPAFRRRRQAAAPRRPPASRSTRYGHQRGICRAGVPMQASSACRTKRVRRRRRRGTGRCLRTRGRGVSPCSDNPWFVACVACGRGGAASSADQRKTGKPEDGHGRRRVSRGSRERGTRRHCAGRWWKLADPVCPHLLDADAFSGC